MLTGVPEKLEAQGGKGGNQWDDGADHDGVTKIDIAAGGLGIAQIKFSYVKNGEPIDGPVHGVKGRSVSSTFVISHPDEYLVSVEGWYDSSNIIQGIKFQSNKNTSQYFGYEFSGDGTQFSLQVKDKKIISFHGFADTNVNALGAYFAPISSLTPSNNSVTKIYISSGNGGIEQIKFNDVEKGETKERPYHGVKGKNIISTVAVSNHPDKSLVYLESWYDSSNVFQGIKFKTDKNTSDFFGYKLSEDDGTPFSLQVKNKKIIGFTRLTDSNLNSPGTYFVLNHSSLTPPNKVEAQGGTGGETFDDGAFDHVRKVYIGQGDSGVAYVKFEYEKDGRKETREHGKMTLLGTEEFEVDSDDYITSIEVSLDNVFGFNSEIVTALVFKTFKGKTSLPFRMVTEKKFELKDGNGGKLAGFHGKASDVLYALGAYFVTTSSTPLTPSTAKKLQARGGNGGASWDDGAFDGVRKILVGQGNDGVAFVAFEYNKGSQVIIGDGHGKQTLLGTETFELDYPSEYITSVFGYYDKVFGAQAEVMTSLTFKTNKRTSQPFGLAAGELFELKEEGYKIVGFHGKAGDVVHQIGVYVEPIFTNYRVVL
ncbi:Myrosinase-binding protein 1 [Cardamine amara subsp. amara]|uniref:Myrosinase-binding protein 1 n=1 Tax=Cardamine amara subsp. amara TaxID=228776 RepID=A0ABD1B0C6_CARAN